MGDLHALIKRWRTDAACLRLYGAVGQADLLETVAREVEEAASSEAERVLTLAQAAERTGYTVDHLGRLLREGRIPNVGRRSAPRIRVADLPRRPRGLSQGINDAYDPTADARSLMSRRNGGANGDSSSEA